MSPDRDSHTPIPKTDVTAETRRKSAGDSGFLRWLGDFFKPEAESTLRETIDDYISKDGGVREADAIGQHERLLLSNILKLRHMTVHNVMIPRADIVAIEVSTTQEELLKLLADKQFSRIPVFRSTLDEVLGTIHIKDVLASLAQGHPVDIKALIREIPIVSPAMPIIDLMLTMRQSRRHMVLVVDEYGGIDGLVTVNDVIESIVGEIEDEHDTAEGPKIIKKSDGSFLIDARIAIDEFEARFGKIFSNDERNLSDTLSGLVVDMTGRIPARGEVLTHASGMIFEIMDADPRRINTLKVRNIPQPLE